MRLHVQHQGRNTTVSIDPLLLELLAAKMCGGQRQDEPAWRHQRARALVRRIALQAPSDPACGLSQFVQSAALLAVCDPALLPSLRSSSEAVKSASAALLGVDTNALVHELNTQEQARQERLLASLRKPVRSRLSQRV